MTARPVHHCRRLLALVLFLPLLVLGACDGPEDRRPEINREAIDQGYKLYELVEKTYPSHDLYELEHQLVQRSEKPAKVMEFLDLKPGQTVCDIGCGSGFYTFKFAEAVGPEGLVYAIDIQPQAIDFIKQRVADEELNPHGNIKVMLTKVDDAMIPADTLDAGLFSHADFYAFPKMLDENLRMLRSIYKATRPGGTLVVVQDMNIVRGTSRAIISENIQKVGFEEDLFWEDPEGTDLYFRFRKPKRPRSSQAPAPSEELIKP